MLSSGVEFMGKLTFSLYGLIVGLLLGFGFAILLNMWNAAPNVKTHVILIFLLLGIAPMFWAYFDFEENMTSSRGLMIMLAIDMVALILVFILNWNERRKLLPTILTIPIWQIISLFWFICLTWKEMNYWD